MELWAVFVTALGGLSGLAGLITAISSARISARKSEVDSLREIVETLREENGRLRDRIFDLETENSDLRKVLGLRPRKEGSARYKGLALHDNS